MTVFLLMNPDSLAWDDFIQQDDKPRDPDSGEEHSAMTSFDWDWPDAKSVRKGSQVGFSDNTLMVTPDARIWKDSEALKDKTKGDALLSHEQLHYDVAHAIGRVVVKKLEALRAKDSDTLDTEAFKLLEYHFRRRGKLIHRAYDKETKHGADAPNQKIWKDLMKQTLANKDALQIGGWWL
jgi:hypothetical protein